MTVQVAPKLYELHLGTSWDFVFHPRINPYINVLEGLLVLCDKIDKGEFPKDVILKGNPYFMKSSTLTRFGFKDRRLNCLEYFMTLLSFPESTILLSISRRELKFANLKHNRIVYINSSDLLANKPIITLLLNRMKHTSNYKIVHFDQTKLPKVNAS